MKNKSPALQFIKFCLVGAVNTGVCLGIYYIFIAINDNLHLAGYIVGFIFSIFVSYLLNRIFVFGQAKDTHSVKAIIKIYIAYGITLAVGSGFILFQTNVLGISRQIVPITNLCVTMPLNFCLNKFWVFR